MRRVTPRRSVAPQHSNPCFVSATRFANDSRRLSVDSTRIGGGLKSCSVQQAGDRLLLAPLRPATLPPRHQPRTRAHRTRDAARPTPPCRDAHVPGRHGADGISGDRLGQSRGAGHEIVPFRHARSAGGGFPIVRNRRLPIAGLFEQVGAHGVQTVVTFEARVRR